MQLIRCTLKLQKEMGFKKSDLREDEPVFSYLGSWHANLIHIDRRKCILFVNDKTFFNFIAPDVGKVQIRELSTLFRGYLQCVLAEEGFDELTKRKIMMEYDDVGFAKTNSKQVLGSMNDLAFHYRCHILAEGGVHSCMVPSIISQLNRMPMKGLKYRYPIEALRAMYETAIE